MTCWPHAPLHRLDEAGAYIVTAGTYEKQHHFLTQERLTFLHDRLLVLTAQYGWQLQAWAVFSNHYHFIACSPADAAKLTALIRHLHSDTARRVNELDGTPGRKVWFDYWETHLTYPRSYLARLKVVHDNAVRHRLVKEASAYPFCSAGWFEREASPAFVKTVHSFRIDAVQVPDAFDVCWER